MSVEGEDYSLASSNVSGILISEVHDVSSRIAPEYGESKQEIALPPGYQHYSTVHTYLNYGFVASCLQWLVVRFYPLRAPSLKHMMFLVFQVQQPYIQFYHSGVDNEGRLYEPAGPEVNGDK
ncbi:hypothetical protein OROMI_010659 [Orobanche minor]